MPHINTDSIPGYAEMTAEEKLEALLKVEIPDSIDLSGYVPKSQFDKTASELAEKKRQEKAKMGQEEAALSELREALEKAQETIASTNLQLEEQKKINLISSYKNNYLALGYDEALAEDTAKAMADGKMDKVFANQKKAAEAAETKLRSEITQSTPRPNGSGGADGQQSRAAQIAAEYHNNLYGVVKGE